MVLGQGLGEGSWKGFVYIDVSGHIFGELFSDKK